MSDTTTIEWTATRLPDGTSLPGYTFNPWRGCQKVSAGCEHCYAEALSARNPGVLGEWGPKGRRVEAAPQYWKKPELWNLLAQNTGIRRRVFCASLADVFEDRPELTEPRHRLLYLIQATPHLDWLLLTKRPENIRPLLERARNAAGFAAQTGNQTAQAQHAWLTRWLDEERNTPPDNVWLGTSVENQQTLPRVGHLLKVAAKFRFLSCEPLLGPLLQGAPAPERASGHLPGLLDLCHPNHILRAAACLAYDQPVPRTAIDTGIHWIIAGGESGPQARPMNIEWAEELCGMANYYRIGFFFKQWGAWVGVRRDRESQQRHAQDPAWHNWPWKTSQHHPTESAVSIRARGNKADEAPRLFKRTWQQDPQQ